MKWGSGLILPVVLALGAMAAVWAARTPAPLGPDAPATAFSASRAMIDDRAIAARPHPTGSAEAGLVRAYLQQRMAALGLDPHVQDGDAVEVWRSRRGASGAHVENLVGRLAGQDPTAPAVVLMAHTDSVPASPGAADDGAGVSAVLEIVRALKASGPRHRDVVVVLTDGEEAGLLGARAFFASADPLRAHAGVVVNFDSRGGGGRTFLIQTGDADGRQIDLFRQAVSDTNTSSLASAVLKVLPNDTDFTIPRALGLPGYNFAFIGRQFDYHAASSTPAALDRGALQHMGDQGLAVTRALAGAASLPAPSADRAYSDLMGRTVLAYPAAVGGWTILLASVLFAAVSVVIGQRRETGRGPNLLALGFSAIGVTAVAALTGIVLWIAARALPLGRFEPDRVAMAQFPLVMAGFVLVMLGSALVFSGPVQRTMSWTVLTAARSTRWSAWGGIILVLALLDLVLQLQAPGLAVLTAVPLAAAALLMAAIAVAGRGRLDGVVAVVCAAIVGGLVTAHLAHELDEVFAGVGLSAPWVLAVFVILAAPALYPLLEGWGRFGARGQLAAAALVLVGAGLLTVTQIRPPWTSSTPMAVQALFLQDNVSGKAWRASGVDTLDDWSRRAIGGDRATPQREPIAALNAALWLVPTAPVPIERAQFSTVRDGRDVVIQVMPKSDGRELRLALKPTARLQGLTVNGLRVPITLRPGEVSWLRWLAARDGLTLRFTPPPGAGELDLDLAEVKDGWPGGDPPPRRPPDRMGWGLSDTTVALDALRAKW